MDHGRTPLPTVARRYQSLYQTVALLALWRGLHLLDRAIPIPDPMVIATPIVGLIVIVLARPPLGYGSPSLLVRLRAFSNNLAEGSVRRIRDNAAVAAVAVVATTILAHAIIGPARPCGSADCVHYAAMVEDLSYSSEKISAGRVVWEEYGSHHLMRILPPLFVRGLMAMGLSMDLGFRVVSVTAILTFGLGLVVVLRLEGARWLLALGMTLVVLGADKTMTLPFRSVYQATDAFTYPISLFLMYAVVRGNWKLAALLSFLGIASKQSLLPLAVFGFIWLAMRAPEVRERVRMVALLVLVLSAHLALARYYHANETVMRHLIPSSDLFSQTTVRRLVDGRLLELVYPLIPVLVLAGRKLASLLREYWFVFAYALILLTQPVMVADLTDGALDRLLMQGLWPIYFAVGVTLARNPTGGAASLALLAYGILMFDGTRDPVVRLALAVVLTIWFLSRRRTNRPQRGQLAGGRLPLPTSAAQPSPRVVEVSSDIAPQVS